MLKNKVIKEIASDLKIDICRVTHGGDLDPQMLKRRSDSDFWPQPFVEQDIQRSTDLSLHLEGLRSVIVTGVRYGDRKDDDLYLSNYVTKKDYHDFLREEMRELVERLRAKAEERFEHKIFVDDAPFLEKAVAARAGAGFIGKNSMLIHPEYGSYIFLGEILTDLEIEIDDSIDTDCGECSLCLDNCEGGALKEAYLVHGDRCISYLTQKKGILTVEERKRMGRHIWGCDSCQEVCPYNEDRSSRDVIEEMEPFDKDLEYFLKLDRNSPPSELEDTAMLWRGSRILIRNALIVTANLERVEYFDLVEQRLEDDSPVIRLYAVWSLSQLDPERAKPILEEHLPGETDKKVQGEIKLVQREIL